MRGVKLKILFLVAWPLFLHGEAKPGWLPQGNLSGAVGIKDIISLPWNQNIFIAVGYDGNARAGIWKSIDGGHTWSYKLWTGHYDWFEHLLVDSQHYRIWTVGHIGNGNPLYYSLDGGETWTGVSYPESIDSVGYGWQIFYLNGYIYYGGKRYDASKIKLYRYNTNDANPANWSWEYVTTFDGCNSIGGFYFSEFSQKLYAFVSKSAEDSVRVYELSLDAPATNVNIKATLPVSSISDVVSHGDSVYVAGDSLMCKGRIYTSNNMADWTLIHEWDSYTARSLAFLDDTLFVVLYTNNDIRIQKKNLNIWETTFHPDGATRCYVIRTLNFNLWIGTEPNGDVFKAIWDIDTGGVYVMGPTWVYQTEVHDDTLFFTTDYTYGEIYDIPDDSTASVWKTFNDASRAYAIHWWGDTVLVSVDAGNLIKKSTDGGATWEYTFKPDGASQVRIFKELSDSSLIIGTGNYGNVLRASYMFDTGGVYVMGPTWVYDTKFCCNKVYIGTNYDNGEIWVSNDTGRTWTNLIGPTQPWGNVYSLVVIGDTIYAGTDYNGDVYKSTDGGATWDSTGDLAGASRVYSLFLSRSAQPGKLFAGTAFNGDVFLSDTTVFDLSPPQMVDEPTYTPTDSNTVYCRSAGVDAYMFECATDSLFLNTVEFSPWVEDTFYTFHNLQDGVTYYYRVYGKICEYTSDASDYTWSIQDASPPTFYAETPTDSVWINDAMPLISVHFLDTVSGVNLSTVSMTLDGSSVSATVTDSTVSYQPATLLSDGAHTVVVSASDNVGNSATYSWTILIDTHPPETPALAEPEPHEMFDTNEVEFDWGEVFKFISAEVNSFKGKKMVRDIVATLRYTQSGDTSAPVRYVFEVSTSPDFSSLEVIDTLDTTGTRCTLSEGVHYCRVHAFDLAGNIGAYSEVRDFIVDTTGPSAPALISPDDGHLTNDNTVSLAWSQATDNLSGVRFYRLEVATEPSFGSPTVYDSLTSTFYTLPEMADGVYYWRVAAVDSAGNMGSYSEARHFEIDTQPPEAVTLTSPPEAYLNYSNIHFEWTSVSKQPLKGNAQLFELAKAESKSAPVNYIIEVALDSNFAMRMFTDTVEVNHYDFSFASNNVYWWRVRAFDLAGNVGPWSDGRWFGVDTVPPYAPALISPEDGSVFQSAQVEFIWHEALDNLSGASHYTLQFSTDPNFGFGTITVSNISDTAFSPGISLAEETYYWRVKAYDGAGNESDWSEIWNFYIDNTPPETPSLISPLNEYLTEADVDFEWTAVSKGSPVSYVVEIASDSSFASIMVMDTVDSNGYRASMPEGRFWWHVKAFDLAGFTSDWSEAAWFVVDTSAPNAVELIAPSDEVVLDTNFVTFVWHSSEDVVSGLDHYVLRYAFDSGLSSGLHEVTLTDTSYSLTLSDSCYYWQVEAFDSAGNASASEIRMFVIDTHAPEIPVLITPVGGEWLHSTTVTFEWTRVEKIAKADAKATPVHYVVEVLSGGSTVLIDTVDTNTMTVELSEGVYDWHVMAFDEAGNTSDWSPIDSFGVDVTPPSGVELIAPENNSILNTSEITFDWSDAVDTTSGIAGYWLALSMDVSFASADSFFVSSSETTLTLADTTWFWKVKAVDNSGLESDWTLAWMLTVDTHTPETPTLVSPVGGEWLHSTSVTFEWTRVEKLAESDAKATPVHYVVEVLSGGSTVLIDTVDTNTMVVELSEGVYDWHVMAFDEAGNTSDWSPIDSFGVDVTPPSAVELIAPENNSILNTSEITFDWSDAVDTTSGIAGYWLAISMDVTFASADSFFVSSSETTLTLADTTWFWKVKAVDNSGLESDWTLAWMLTIDTHAPDTPTLVSPVGGEWLHSTSVTFEWTRVEKIAKADAKATPVHYVVEVLSGGLTVLIDTVDTNTMVVELNEGIYDWHVMAFDEAGNASDWSPTDSFGVDVTPPSTPDLVSPADGFITSSNSTEFIWTASTDNLSGIMSYSLTVGDSVWNTSDTSITVDLSCLSEGTYAWHVEVFDNAENFAVTGNRTLVIDRTPPAIDSFSVWADTSWFFGPFEVNAWISDNLSGVGSAWLFWSVDGSPFDSVAMNLSGGVWSGEIPALGDSANHTVSYFVKAADIADPPNAGTSDTVNFTITSIAEHGRTLPDHFDVFGVVPNPARGGRTKLKLALPKKTDIEVVVYDAAGRSVWKEKREVEAGYVSLPLELPTSSGVYLLKVSTKFGQRTLKVLVTTHR